MCSNPMDSEYAAAIRAARSTRWLGRPLHYHATVTSTNDLLGTMAREGSPAGTMVVADFQSRGRGRLDRRWLAPAGTSLLLSLLFRPTWSPERATWLTMIAGLAAVEAIESLSDLKPGLKWPNDLMLHTGKRWLKVGGMLLEGQLTDGRWEASILGVGINVNVAHGEIPEARWPATSLLKELGREIDRAELLGVLLHRLETHYEQADKGHSPQQAWQSKLITIGRQVTVTQNANRRPLVGIAVRTDEWGRLVIRDRDGQEHAVSAGDVVQQVDNSLE